MLWVSRDCLFFHLCRIYHQIPRKIGLNYKWALLLSSWRQPLDSTRPRCQCRTSVLYLSIDGSSAWLLCDWMQRRCTCFEVCLSVSTHEINLSGNKVQIRLSGLGVFKISPLNGFFFSLPWCNATSGLLILSYLFQYCHASDNFLLKAKQSIKLLCNFSNYKAFSTSFSINPLKLWAWFAASHILVSSDNCFSHRFQ